MDDDPDGREARLLWLLLGRTRREAHVHLQFEGGAADGDQQEGDDDEMSELLARTLSDMLLGLSTRDIGRLTDRVLDSPAEAAEGAEEGEEAGAAQEGEEAEAEAREGLWQRRKGSASPTLEHQKSVDDAVIAQEAAFRDANRLRPLSFYGDAALQYLVEGGPGPGEGEPGEGEGKAGPGGGDEAWNRETLNEYRAWVHRRVERKAEEAAARQQRRGSRGKKERRRPRWEQLYEQARERQQRSASS